MKVNFPCSTPIQADEGQSNYCIHPPPSSPKIFEFRVFGWSRDQFMPGPSSPLAKRLCERGCVRHSVLISNLLQGDPSYSGLPRSMSLTSGFAGKNPLEGETLYSSRRLAIRSLYTARLWNKLEGMLTRYRLGARVSVKWTSATKYSHDKRAFSISYATATAFGTFRDRKKLEPRPFSTS